MFAQPSGFFKGLLALVCAFALIALAGCGDDGSPASTGSSDSAGSETTTTAPDPADTADADPADLKVIEDWSSTLSSGDAKGAARFFATPSTAENGPVLLKIETLDDAIAFNESLPCGAEVISARTQGDFTNATFRLSDRPGGDCGPGAGGKASTSFEITNGKIVQWRRVDGTPGGGSSPLPGGDSGSTV